MTCADEISGKGNVVFTGSPFVLDQAEPMHREHAQIEQVFADREDFALARLPSGKFTANAAWLNLAATAYNLTRAVGHLASVFHTRARTGTIRRHLVHVPTRIATGARRVALHLPQRWCRSDDFTDQWTATGQCMVTLTCATALPAHDPKDVGEPAPDGHPAHRAARTRKITPNPLEDGDQNSRGGSRLRTPCPEPA